MPDYQKMYYTLVHAITDALECISMDQKPSSPSRILRKALRDAEDIYIQTAEDEEK